MKDAIEDRTLKKTFQENSTKIDLGVNVRDDLFAPYKHKLSPYLELDPERCKPWQYHDRDVAWLTKENCQDLIKSIQAYGQLEPALVRKLQGDPEYDYEIIYGVRRWFACSQIEGQKFVARSIEASDKICGVLMHTENAASKNITEFERAYSFARQIKAGIFKSQVEMGEMMGLSQGHVSKLINAGSIFDYPWVKKLFETKIHIPIKYAYELSVLLKKESFYEPLKKEAEAILSEKQTKGTLPSPTQVLKRLIRVRTHSENYNKNIILGSSSRPLVYYSRDRFGKFSLFIKKEARTLDLLEIEKKCVNEIKKYLLG